MKMKRGPFTLRFAAAAALLPAAALHAAGTIGYFYPAGAARGTSVSVLVGGQSLWGLRAVRITGEGVRCDKAETVGGIPYGPGCSEQGKFLRTWIRDSPRCCRTSPNANCSIRP